MEIVQSVTSNRSDIPAHYIPISSYGCHKGNTDKKATDEYKLLYRAWCDEEIGGIKFMANPHDKRGKIFVDPADASRLIDAMRRPKRPLLDQAAQGSVYVAKPATASQSQIEAAVLALCEINNGIAVLGDTLRNLVAAVDVLREQHAKQHEPAGSWRDMNGDVMN